MTLAGLADSDHKKHKWIYSNSFNKIAPIQSN